MDQVATVTVIEKRMNPEVKATWVKALRGDDYLQGDGALCAKHTDRITRMCCLGVLTDLYIKSEANVAKMDWEPNKSQPVNRMCFEGCNALLTRTVWEWAGLSSAMGGLIDVSEEMKKQYGMETLNTITLPILNDFKVPFEVIADIIDEQR